MLKRSTILAGCAAVLCLTACNGVFDDIYDSPSADDVKVEKNQLYVDAHDWGYWYYISFDSLEQYVESGDTAALSYAQTHFTPYAIPKDSLGSGNGTSQETGIYTYWFDVFGQGMDNNRLRWFRKTAGQPEPAEWDIAIHRQNVRTNNASVLETNYTSLDDLPESSASFTGAEFTSDEWSEKDVWADQSLMLQSLIGCQGIKINKALVWLNVDIPPMPPSYRMNNHVFVIKLKDGKMAAVQLVNYKNPSGTACYFTINYKYPY